MTETALASIEVVTADEHPGLFWAVHDGGNGAAFTASPPDRALSALAGSR